MKDPKIEKAISEFEKEADKDLRDKFGTVLEKVKQDNGWWLSIQFDGESEPRWVHESRLSKIEEH